MNDLANHITYIVDKLALIERRPHPSDRRARQLVLTPEGDGLRERLLALLREESPLAGLTPQEQSALHDLLRRAMAGR